MIKIYHNGTIIGTSAEREVKYSKPVVLSVHFWEADRDLWLLFCKSRLDSVALHLLLMHIKKVTFNGWTISVKGVYKSDYFGGEGEAL